MSLIFEATGEETCLKAGDLIFIETLGGYNLVSFVRNNPTELSNRILDADLGGKLIFPVGDRCLLATNVARIVGLLCRFVKKGTENSEWFELF